jgi:putative tryptophan/tyrosine transport system substrate-binding protein
MQFAQLKRREFIVLLGGAAAWPFAARGQQPVMPVIGFMSARSADDREQLAAAFRRGLNEYGLVEGQNVSIEYRWAEFDFERLPGFAADLVRRKVDVIATISGTPTVLAAKSATGTIPIVFVLGSDPIASGVVNSLSRPSDNLTGVTIFGAMLGRKRLGLLRELAPNATLIGVLVDPDNPVSVADAASMQEAAGAIGQQIQILNTSAGDHIDGAFRIIGERRISALLVTGDVFFVGQRDKLVTLAARYAIPTICILAATLWRLAG